MNRSVFSLAACGLLLGCTNPQRTLYTEPDGTRLMHVSSEPGLTHGGFDALFTMDAEGFIISNHMLVSTPSVLQQGASIGASAIQGVSFPDQHEHHNGDAGTVLDISAIGTQRGCEVAPGLFGTCPPPTP